MIRLNEVNRIERLFEEKGEEFIRIFLRIIGRSLFEKQTVEWISKIYTLRWRRGLSVNRSTRNIFLLITSSRL